ncbi:hypothetical protein HPB50_023761 [Hyalomma asiaticum]|uniref:Uncharacterized protein n=1 Tax=Hyalomma asiaticum TaxID=266040 RepID=A0ACB7RW37_HYAAI|nr:hypothetical protein HPB50_023761 [Hyalomma asiaticum]
MPGLRGPSASHLGSSEDGLPPKATLVGNHIEEHNSAKYQDDAESFIRGYVNKVKESAGDPEPLFTEAYLIGIINGFLTAGTFTTTSTMVWNLVNFARHPDTVQARVQREIDDVVGHEHQPTWEDRRQMPYTMACIWEMERWKTGAPIGAAKE